MKIAVIDCETTGLDRNADHVVDVVIRDYENPTENVRMWRVRPPIPIPEKISAIHGITDDMVFHSPSFGEVADEIAKEISQLEVIVGYNPDFDVQMLQREFRIAVVEVRWPRVVICSKRLWDTHEPIKRSLTDAYVRFVSPEGFEGAHGALADTLATYKVLRSQLESFGLTDKSWAELDPERLKWYGPSSHVVWQDSYREVLVANFGKFTGKPFMEIDVGYLKYIEQKDFPDHVKKLAVQAQKIARERTDDATKIAALTQWARGQQP